jgi:ribonuclease P protein component
VLPAASKLRRPQEFSAVVRSGRRASTRHLVVHLLPTGPGQASRRTPGTQGSGSPASSSARTARAGFVISAKVGNSVVRHRIVRRLRPLVRDRLAGLPAGTDLVIRALPAAAQADSATLAADLDAGLGGGARQGRGTPTGATP